MLLTKGISWSFHYSEVGIIINQLVAPFPFETLTATRIRWEIAKIIPVTQDTIDRLVKELRRGHDEAIAEVHRLKDEAVEVGKEIGRCEEILQANEWFNELLALVQGEESLESKLVRVIVLRVLCGAAAWLKHNEADTLRFSNLPFTLENLIKELEQWKV